ncbi:MAG TPA: hypothetical protein VF221_00305 [Chloroflexota bacterium]
MPVTLQSAAAETVSQSVPMSVPTAVCKNRGTEGTVPDDAVHQHEPDAAPSQGAIMVRALPPLWREAESTHFGTVSCDYLHRGIQRMHSNCSSRSRRPPRCVGLAQDARTFYREDAIVTRRTAL